METTLSLQTVTIAVPQGYINATNALEFERDLTAVLIREEASNLMVNLEKVESLDSSGLMALVSTFKLAQGLNKKLNICSVNPSVRIIFELTQLDKIFLVNEK